MTPPSRTNCDTDRGRGSRSLIALSLRRQSPHAVSGRTSPMIRSSTTMTVFATFHMLIVTLSRATAREMRAREVLSHARSVRSFARLKRGSGSLPMEYMECKKHIFMVTATSLRLFGACRPVSWNGRSACRAISCLSYLPLMRFRRTSCTTATSCG